MLHNGPLLFQRDPKIEQTVRNCLQLDTQLLNISETLAAHFAIDLLFQLLISIFARMIDLCFERFDKSNLV